MIVFTAWPDQRLDIGQSGARRMRLRSRLWIERALLGSGLLHLLVLLAILLLMLPSPPREPGSSNPVTIIFEPSLPGARPDQPEGKPLASAPVEGPQMPPPPGNEVVRPPSPKAEPAPAEPLPVPPPPPAVVPDAVAQPRPAPPAPVAATQPRPRPSPQPSPKAEAQRAAPLAEPSLSAPMNFSFGGITGDPLRTRPTGRRNTIDPTLGADIANRVGAPPTDVNRPNASIKVTGAQVGTDWITMLHGWWAQHGYYPPQAAQNGEDGTVRIHVVVDRYGKVLGVELIGKSGSQWLDLAAQAVFRGATLPPFPPNTPEPRADLELTINYLLYRR